MKKRFIVLLVLAALALATAVAQAGPIYPDGIFNIETIIRVLCGPIYPDGIF
ncbi:MAG TPA: hypothetical protein GXX29_01325 [Firmicutes bacterium]|nr:hypothetical protein [Bacillota bacterium]